MSQKSGSSKVTVKRVPTVKERPSSKPSELYDCRMHKKVTLDALVNFPGDISRAAESLPAACVWQSGKQQHGQFRQRHLNTAKQW